MDHHNDQPLRLLLCKPGLDGHDRGVKLLARACRDGGMEVIYGGVRQRLAEITAIAVQEDVDIIGVSNHSGVLAELCEDLVASLSEAGAPSIPIVAGGTLVGNESAELTRVGVKAVFGPGTPVEEIVQQIRDLAEEHRNVTQSHS